MTDLKQAAQQALEALVTCCAEEWRTLNNFGMKQVYDEKKVNAAIAALHAALAEPQTTHWEGCEAVHPECRKPEQEPVAWQIDDGRATYVTDRDIDAQEARAEGWRVTPLTPEPTPHKPLKNEMVKRMKEIYTSTEMQGAFTDGWLSAEAAHGITGEQT